MKCKAIIENIEANRLYVKMLKIGKRKSTEEYIVNISNLNCDTINFEVGNQIEIHFNGIVTLSLPPQISAIKIKKVL